MANTKISQLSANTSPNGGEELVYAYNNSNGKMTLNTMKAFAGKGKQDTLVSGTNIKTINNQSLLGSGNIDIQGGGGGGAGADAYDAIVDASGGGDYTTIGAAVDDNKRNIFVKNGTYNESLGHYVTASGVDKFIIHGETRTGVVINATLTQVPTTWGQFYDYPALFFLDLRSTDSMEIKVENITCNFSVNSSEYKGYLINGYWKSGCMNNSKITNCNFNISNDGTVGFTFIPVGCVENASSPDGILSISNCVFIGTSNTARLTLDNDDSNLVSRCDNCYFYSKANNNNNGEIRVENIFNSEIEFNYNNMGLFSLDGENIESCKIYGGNNIEDTTKLDIKLINIRHSDLHIRHESSYHPTQISTSGIIPEWQSSTAYSVGDQIIEGGAFYECITAHTSSSFFYDDEDNWKMVATIQLENAIGNTIKTGDTIQVKGKISGNTFIMDDTGDVIMPTWCLFEGNNFESSSSNYNHKMYVNTHSIINGNVFGDYYYEHVDIYYVSTEQNIITNNIVYILSAIKKLGTGNGGVIDNNIDWSV